MENRVKGSNASDSYNYNDLSWYHHSGMEKDSANNSYTNRGQTITVWKTLPSYGFSRTGSNLFEGGAVEVSLPAFDLDILFGITLRSS